MLASVFCGLVDEDGPGDAAAAALFTSVGVICVALVVAALEVRAGPPGRHRAGRMEYLAMNAQH